MKRIFMVAAIATLGFATVGFATAPKTASNYGLYSSVNVSNHSKVTTIDKDTIIIKGEIDEEVASKFIKEYSARDKSKEFLVVIDSPGGSVYSALKMIDAIDANPNSKVLALSAASAAFMIVQAFKTREVTSYSTLMQHQASFAIPQMPTENSKAFFKYVTDLLDQVEARQAARLELSVAVFKQKIENDWWLAGSEIIANKAADVMVHAVCSPDLLAKETKEKVKTMFGPQDKVTQSCPIL